MSIETKDIVQAVRKHPIGFVAGLLAVALVAASTFRADGVGALETQLEERSREGQRQQTNLTNAIRLDEHLATLTKANEDIAARAVDSRELASNLQYFYELEAGLGVKLIELRQGAPTAKAKGSAYLAVPYTVAIEAPFERVVQFLQALENGSRYARFVSVTLQPRASDASGPGKSATAPAQLITLSMTVELLGTS